jgi:AcrR family transcriptional regulator
VVDPVALSGVSRSSFYDHFGDKRGCFLAAIDALTGPSLERLTGNPQAVVAERGTGPRRLPEPD